MVHRHVIPEPQKLETIVGEEGLPIFTSDRPIRLRQALVADSRIFAIVVELRQNLRPIAQFLNGLERQVVHPGADVGEAGRVGLIVSVIDQITAFPQVPP